MGHSFVKSAKRNSLLWCSQHDVGSSMCVLCSTLKFNFKCLLLSSILKASTDITNPYVGVK